MIVAIQVGNTIDVGFSEFKEFLIAITVVGINCIEAVFIIINIIIELVNLSFELFSFCIVFIAFRPKGVAAFPKPKILAIIFMEICFFAVVCSFKSGKRRFKRGLKRLDNLFIKVVLFAICIIPLQRHKEPSKFIDKLIASFVPWKIALFNFSKLPEKIAKENDIIIKIGQTIFNILSPK